MSIYQTHLDVTIVKCLVTKITSMVDMLYAATVVNLNILDQLACVKNGLNVSTAQVITLRLPNKAWEKERKILKIKCENNILFSDARKQNKM